MLLTYRLFIVIFLSGLISLAVPSLVTAQSTTYTSKTFDTPRFWQIQSIDTMKYSRDESRKFLGDLKASEQRIDKHIRQIAEIGATHVAIATPYDEEFLPVLQLWVAAARRHNLKVWFRGNWAGWEGWFGYDKISRTQHLEKTKQFILTHPELFKDGDIFTGCPECENGGPGDPRRTGDVKGHRQFLLDEYEIVTAAFSEINRDVITNLESMNGDVARLTMDPTTTKKLGGVITVDHYVSDPIKLADDLIEYSDESGGQVMLGEFGAPIPDLHGRMSEAEQADWLDKLFLALVQQPNLIGMNYWTSVGGSTAVWHDDGTARQAVTTLQKWYKPSAIEITPNTITGQSIQGVEVKTLQRTYSTNEQGVIKIPYVDKSQSVTISASGYLPIETTIEAVLKRPNITLAWEPKPFIPSLMERLKWFINSLLSLRS